MQPTPNQTLEVFTEMRNTGVEDQENDRSKRWGSFTSRSRPPHGDKEAEENEDAAAESRTSYSPVDQTLGMVRFISSTRSWAPQPAEGAADGGERPTLETWRFVKAAAAAAVKGRETSAVPPTTHVHISAIQHTPPQTCNKTGTHSTQRHHFLHCTSGLPMACRSSKPRRGGGGRAGFTCETQRDDRGESLQLDNRRLSAPPSTPPSQRRPDGKDKARSTRGVVRIPVVYQRRRRNASQ